MNELKESNSVVKQTLYEPSSNVCIIQLLTSVQGTFNTLMMMM